MMVDYVRKMTAKKPLYGEYGSFEHYFALLVKNYFCFIDRANVLSISLCFLVTFTRW